MNTGTLITTKYISAVTTFAVVAAAARLPSRQEDAQCRFTSGGPNAEQQKAVADVMKQHLPLVLDGVIGFPKSSKTL